MLDLAQTWITSSFPQPKPIWTEKNQIAAMAPPVDSNKYYNGGWKI